MPSSTSHTDLASPASALHQAHVLVGNAIALIARAARSALEGGAATHLVYEADRYLEQADQALRRASTMLEDLPPIDQVRGEVRELARPPRSRRALRDFFAERIKHLRELRSCIGAALYRDPGLRSSGRPSRMIGARTTLADMLKQAPGSKRAVRWWIAAGVLAATWLLLTLGQC